MKNIRLFIENNKLDMLKAFSDDSYLYNYIVNNYSELPEDNIFRNPTILKKINNMIYFSKIGINMPGEMSPLSGCCQRTNASAPTKRPLEWSYWG